jgi:L-ascorbate metabolism protein UlaG (beta-lactamase superfamily)
LKLKKSGSGNNACQENRRVKMHEIIKFTTEKHEGLALCWLGNDGWLLSSGGHLIATDLDLGSKERILPSPVSLEEIADNLEILLITHDHGDHFNSDTCKFLNKHSKCRFVLPESCMPYAREYGLCEERIIRVLPRQEYSLAEWLQIKTLRAFHGHLKHSVYYNANTEDCGYVIYFGGFTIMQPGDTVLLQEHIEMTGIDILFISPTEHNTHLEGSLNMINSIEPQYIFAQHFGTYVVNDKNSFWTIGYPDELNALLSDRFKSRFNKPVQGETTVLHKVIK